jgi:GT2 family glycosyltransferase
MERLAQLRYPHLEILVVDNAPVDESTLQLTQRFSAADARFRYVREDRPGLSYARNRALSEATGALLAFTDDDVWVDRCWVDGLVRGFETSPRVGCVTGLVATASVRSRAEAYFDARAASWSSRLAAQVFDPADPPSDDPLFPFSAGRFGTGANFCFDRDLMRSLGGFDVHLGAGTATRGGEDLDAFVRVLRSGRCIRYEPSALVWHHHRADGAALLGQMYSYGTGLSAFMVKCLLDGAMRRDVLKRVPLGLVKMLRIRRETEDRLPRGVPAPRGVLIREVAGMAVGVPLYLRSRRYAGEP